MEVSSFSSWEVIGGDGTHMGHPSFQWLLVSHERRILGRRKSWVKEELALAEKSNLLRVSSEEWFEWLWICAGWYLQLACDVPFGMVVFHLAHDMS